MKKILILILVLFSKIASAQLSAIMDFSRFKGGDTTSIVELYLGVDANSMKLIKNANNKFQGTVLVTITMSDERGIRLANKYSINSPEFETEQPNTQFLVQKRMLVKNADYFLNVSLKDQNTTDSAFSAIIPIKTGFAKEFISISDIQLLESFTKTTEEDDYVKNGFKLISNITDFYPKEVSKIKFYSEIYNSNKQFGDNNPFVVQTSIKNTKGEIANNLGKIQKQTASIANVILNEFDISKLESGNYVLTIEVKDTQNKLIASQTKNFQRSNPELDNVVVADTNVILNYKGTFVEQIPTDKINYYLKALQPISLKNEYEFIMALVTRGDEEQKRNYFYTFWMRRNKLNPEIVWNEYLEKIKIIEKKYAHGRMLAHETDRGRVYLQYGKPYRVETEITDPKRDVRNSNPVPYEIWYYDKLGSQTNKFFCFAQRDIGNYNYRLVNSNVRGEVNDPSWKQQLQQRNDKPIQDDININNRTYDQ